MGTPAAFNFAVSAVTSRTRSCKIVVPGSCVRPVSNLPSMFFHSMNVYVTDVPGIRRGSA